MFTCADRQIRSFFKSSIPKPQARVSHLVKFLEREPWRHILKKELSYDSEDDNCTIIKTFMQDNEKSGSQEPVRDKSDSDSVASRLECWYKLKDLAKFVPELRCIMNDIHYAPSDERISVEDGAVSGQNVKKPFKLEETKPSKVNSPRPVTSKFKSLHEVLYENEEFAKALDGIVYKEILDVINFEGEIDQTIPFSLDKEKSLITPIDPVFLGKSSVVDKELSPVDDIEFLLPTDVEVKDKRRSTLLDEEVVPSTLPSQVEGETVAEEDRLDEDEEEEEFEEEMEEEKLASEEEDEDSEGLTDPGELLDDLLGALNFQDILDEWVISKKERESKIAEKKESKMNQ